MHSALLLDKEKKHFGEISAVSFSRLIARSIFLEKGSRRGNIFFLPDRKFQKRKCSPRKRRGKSHQQMFRSRKTLVTESRSTLLVKHFVHFKKNELTDIMQHLPPRLDYYRRSAPSISLILSEGPVVMLEMPSFQFSYQENNLFMSPEKREVGREAFFSSYALTHPVVQLEGGVVDERGLLLEVPGESSEAVIHLGGSCCSSSRESKRTGRTIAVPVGGRGKGNGSEIKIRIKGKCYL